MTKNVLITAGGTIEAIDRVRSITNTGTGKLGSFIAERLSSYEEINKIFYVHAKNSYVPKSDKAVLIDIKGSVELENTVKKLCTEEEIDAVIHSMAVSDYRVRSVMNINSAENLSKEELLKKFDSENILRNCSKMSSKIENPIILLEQTPKILPMFRKLLPEALIIGFKLLDNVSHRELIDTAYKLLIENGCDYVLANDYISVEANRHEGFLVDKERNEQCRIGKQKIADMIAETIINGGKK